MFMKILAFICLLFFAAAINAQQKPLKKSNSRPAAKAAAGEPFDKATVEQMAAQCVTFETEAGNITLEMFPESAPETVRNFLNLTAAKFFDTTTFSRVVPGFIIQGGDLATRIKTTNEFNIRSNRMIKDEPNLIKHERGIISMARTEQPNSASTNFFILLNEAKYLDGTFAAFGRVTKGMETVEAISKMPVEAEKPKKPVRILRAFTAVCEPAAASK